MRVASWNVENLFRPGDDAGAEAEQEYEAKLEGLAATVTAIAPDVLGAQEIGSAEALDDLVQRLDGDWHTALADPDGRGIRNGFLSRAPIDATEQTREFPDTLAPVQVDDDGTTVHAMGRPALQVRVQVEGVEVDLVCAHLKSKLLTFPGGRFGTDDEDERARFAVYALGRRAAEAATVRELATRLLNGRGRQRAVVVLGDFNDTEFSATTSLLYGPGGSEIGTPGFERPDKGDTQRLWNLGLAIPPELRFSRTYRGRDELIDHLLVSHALVQQLGEVTTVDVDAGSVGDTPGERTGGPASDHRPVVADLVVQPRH